MTPQMIAALSSGSATLTGFFEIDLPSGTRRLLFGSTEVSWGGHTWVGDDPTIGSIDAPDDVREDMTGQAPNGTVSINISPTADRDDIAGQDAQLSPFRCWLAALELDVSKHLQVVPDPELQFDGFIDQATIDLDKGRDDLEYTTISAFDYFFEDGEGQRLNGQFHRSVWTGEKGLDNVTGVDKKIYWGAYGPGGASGATGSTGSSSVGGSSILNDPVRLHYNGFAGQGGA
jgi:hypothetical protein